LFVSEAICARGSGFIALPGSIGTLEEFSEVWTWRQLGLHIKPYGLLDVAGFFAPLLLFLDHLVDE
jgi:predicted Rossmann-fold nucleotide-binding protein